MKWILILFLLHISFEIEPQESVIELDDFFDLIKKENVTSKVAQELIIKLKSLLDRYTYLGILKIPPQPVEDYHEKVDLISKLNNVNTNERPLYDFLRDIKIIIDNCQDLHLNFNLIKSINNFDLESAFFILPIILVIDKGKVYSFPFAESYFDANIINQIKSNNGQDIKSINGKDPLLYIFKIVMVILEN